MFYSKDEFSSSLARTLLIYRIASEKEKFNKEFVDIEKHFIKKYKCSIEDYIFSLFAIYGLFFYKMPKPFKITEDWFQRSAFDLTILDDSAKEILQPLIFTFEEAKRELSDSYQDPWDYRFFSRKPIFKLNDDIIFPVSLTLLENAFNEGLYWKIRDCFPQEDNSFQSFFGRPFELYVQRLVKESCEKSSVPYEVIDEFSYAKSSKRSPDVMIKLGKKLIAIESKAQRVNYKKSIVGGNLESIEKDRIKMTVAPMKQLYKRVKELISGATGKIDLSNVEEVYLIVVNQGEFPVLRPLEQKTMDDWKKLDGIDAKVNNYYMSIDEFEMFTSALERKKLYFVS
ncbi:hypothetical protein [Risungbinella massiliensis]|uniref:hypothetical protein n=1 Tax=Risungbinella massiliensis TaxID=1329796 RepID=UPI0005CC2FE2|nr:hypothetical protein [Risungbinella massiliensis]